MRVKFDSHKCSRSCLDRRAKGESSSIHTRARALVLTTALGAGFKVELHKGSRFFVLTTAFSAGRVKFDLHKEGLSALPQSSLIYTRTRLPHLVRVKFDLHKGSLPCLHTIYTRAHDLVLTTALGAYQVQFTGLTLLS